jgi:hypothetical protein
VSAVVHSRSGYWPFNVRYHSTACVSSPPLYTTFRPPSLCSLHSFFGPCHLLVARRSSLPPSLDASTFLSLLPTLNRPPCPCSCSYASLSLPASLSSWCDSSTTYINISSCAQLYNSLSAGSLDRWGDVSVGREGIGGFACLVAISYSRCSLLSLLSLTVGSWLTDATTSSSGLDCTLSTDEMKFSQRTFSA